MPGSVANAAPSTVMPAMLCAAFTRSQSWPVHINTYAGGESQRSVDAANSRKAWNLTGIFTATELAAMRNFWNARKGGQPFYFYDFSEGAHDPSGVSAAGRYTVTFRGGWEQQAMFPRTTIDLELVETA
jgi:hypothetical protein